MPVPVPVQKRLDFFASALCVYPTATGVSNLIIATHSRCVCVHARCLCGRDGADGAVHVRVFVCVFVCCALRAERACFCGVSVAVCARARACVRLCVRARVCV